MKRPGEGHLERWQLRSRVAAGKFCRRQSWTGRRRWWPAELRAVFQSQVCSLSAVSPGTSPQWRPLAPVREASNAERRAPAPASAVLPGRCSRLRMHARTHPATSWASAGGSLRRPGMARLLREAWWHVAERRRMSAWDDAAEPWARRLPSSSQRCSSTAARPNPKSSASSLPPSPAGVSCPASPPLPATAGPPSFPRTARVS